MVQGLFVNDVVEWLRLSLEASHKRLESTLTKYGMDSLNVMWKVLQSMETLEKEDNSEDALSTGLKRTPSIFCLLTNEK
jgi:hypothetical protein